ncbi:hypothetical protein E2553_27825 [Paraburkholderia dipogonis]|uniref:Uncharacterized protein n=1 Tax=Paraburkholderia dipogonis TaxID=1211383 RepID=A0A4Y8MSM0_9BURK|nr:hypothetical protein E2553_27825 [Paraburkholderia dipogonis]
MRRHTGGQAGTAQAVLEESAKLCGGVRAPLNVEGDRNPSSWRDSVVTATPGFREAFHQFAAAARNMRGSRYWSRALTRP